MEQATHYHKRHFKVQQLFSKSINFRNVAVYCMYFLDFKVQQLFSTHYHKRHGTSNTLNSDDTASYQL